MAIKFAITGLIALIIVAIIIVIFKKLDLGTVIGQTGKSLGDSFKGVRDFFDSLQPLSNSGQTPQEQATQNAQDIFDKQLEDKKQQALDAGFNSVKDFEDSEFQKQIKGKFINPKTGKQDNAGLGISPLDPNFIGAPNLKNGIGTIPEAFGSEFPPTQTVIDARNVSNFPLTLTQFANANQSKAKIIPTTQTVNKNKIIQGNVKNLINTNQKFKSFSSNSSIPARGVIRPIKANPANLRVNSNNVPLETASQRANRVFVETGKFADENRGLGVTSAKVKTSKFNFGTNTGKGLRIPTNPSNSAARRQAALDAAALRASQVFDSRSISNL